MQGEVVGEVYVSMNEEKFYDIIEDIKETQPDVIINTLNGDSNIHFFEQLNKAGINASDIPVMSFSIGESEIKSIGVDNAAGHFVAWPYFKTIDTAFNKKFVKELVRPKLAEIGLTTRKTDDENILRLRLILLALDFYAEDEENLKKLADMYSSDYSELDTEIRADILDAKLYLQPEYLDEYMLAYKNTADPDVKFDLLMAMSLMRDSKGLEKVIELLDQPDVVKPQDQFHLFIFLFRNPEVKERVFEWLEGHWDYVKKISGDKSLDNYPRYMAGSIRTEEEFERYCKFFDPMAKEPALSRATLMGKNEIISRLKLIKSDKDAVAKELNRIEFN